MGQKVRNLTPAQRKASKKAFEAAKKLGVHTSQFIKLIDPWEHTPPPDFSDDGFRQQKGTIYQLSRLSRIIPRILRGCAAGLLKKDNSPMRVKRLQLRQARAVHAANLLKLELHNRGIFNPPVRDARPLKLQRKLGFLPPVGAH